MPGIYEGLPGGGEEDLELDREEQGSEAEVGEDGGDESGSDDDVPIELAPNGEGPDGFKEPEPPKEDRPSRRERREERGRIFQQNKEYEERVRAQEAQIHQMQGQMQALMEMQGRQSQQREPERTREDIELESVDSRISALQEELYKGVSAERGRAIGQESLQLQRKQIELISQRAASQIAAQQPQQPSYADHIRQQLSSSNPDVYGDQRMLAYARAEYHKLIALGEKPGPGTHDRSMDAAREAFGSKARRRPGATDAERSRATGAGRGAGGRGGKKSFTAPSWDANKQHLAESSYPDLKPGEAYQKWVNSDWRDIVNGSE